MAVRADEAMIGTFFVTANQELRKVVRVTTDGQGCPRVWFQCKSAVAPNRPFLFGHTQANPPTLVDFIAQCDHRLSWAELGALRERGILLSGE